MHGYRNNPRGEGWGRGPQTTETRSSGRAGTSGPGPTVHRAHLGPAGVRGDPAGSGPPWLGLPGARGARGSWRLGSRRREPGERGPFPRGHPQPPRTDGPGFLYAAAKWEAKFVLRRRLGSGTRPGRGCPAAAPQSRSHREGPRSGAAPAAGGVPAASGPEGRGGSDPKLPRAEKGRPGRGRAVSARPAAFPRPRLSLSHKAGRGGLSRGCLWGTFSFPGLVEAASRG